MCLISNIVVLLIVLRFTDASLPRMNARIHAQEETKIDHAVAEISQLISKQRSHGISPTYKIVWQKLKRSVSIHAASSPNPGNMWLKIDRRTGTVSFKRPFDRDVECANSEECIIHAQVTVMPRHIFQLIELQIVVDDINDNEPVFPVPTLVLNVSESLSVGDPINLDAYQATDKDFGRNSYLRYSTSSNPYFRLKHLVDEKNSSHFTLYVTKSPDHENVAEMELDVWARDAGSPVMVGEMKLKIKIIDTNDNYPKFEKDVYISTLEENAPAGTTVAEVKASDADGGLFGRIRYSVSPKNSQDVRRLAQIDPNRGTVWLTEALDREKHSGLRILIQARDSGPGNPKTGETWVIINVEDVNDNTPIIAVEFISQSNGDTVYVSESAPNGSYIAKVSVTDSDGGKNGETYLTVTSVESTSKRGEVHKESKKQCFDLTDDGFLVNTEKFDREVRSRYIVLIKTCDRGTPQRCSRKELTVIILDVNEYSPSVEKPLRFVTLREDVYLGTQVATISAKDGDSANGYALTRNETGHIVTSHNGDVTFSIAKDDYGVFSIGKKSGVIRVVSPLDREKKAEWKLTVSVRDGGSPYQESFCTIIVNVEDINDNAPVFLDPAINNSQIYADITSNKVITRIKARDFDEGDNGKVSYYIVHHASTTKDKIQHYQNILPPENSIKVDSYFILNPVSGDLRLNFSKRNMTNAVGAHIIRIRAKDSGKVPLFTEITLRVAVGEHGNGHMGLTDQDVSASSVDFLVLAISLGCATAFLLFLIIGVVIKCRRMNQEIGNMNKTAAMETPIQEKRTLSTRVLASSHTYPQIEQTGAASNKTSDSSSGKEAESSGEKPSERPFRSLSSAPQMLDIDEVPHVNDTDSGNGESDIEAASLLVNESKLYNQRKDVVSKCSDKCRIYGHSDECWMPEVESNGSTGTRPQKPCTLNYYDWDKLKPRCYNSERGNQSRKGSQCSYASTSNTDNASFSLSAATSHRNIQDAAAVDEDRHYRPRHHSVTGSSAAMTYPTLALKYTDTVSAQQQGFPSCQYMDAVYEVNYSVQATGLCHAAGYQRSQTPAISIVKSQYPRYHHVPYHFTASGIPPSPSAHFQPPVDPDVAFSNESNVSMQKAREVFEGIQSLVV